MIQKGLRNNPPSVYDIGEKVLIRYPAAKKIGSKRSILTARILKRNLKTCKYKVQFTFPAGSSKILTKWISVNDMTSTTLDKEKRKRKLACQSSKKMHKKKYLIPFSNHREKFTDMQSEMNFLISYDPPKDGNCQFSALCHELVNIGVLWSAETLRKEIVSFLESHTNSPDGTPLELFAGTPWSQYLRLMACNGTHGDHLTLQAAADIFNIQIVVYSTLGATAVQTIPPTNGCPIATFYLGHFTEGAGEHYVCLADKTISDRSDTEYNCLSPVQDEQSDLGSTSGLNEPGNQSQSDADQYATDINTTHGNRTRLHENEEQDTNNQCGYEQQGNDRASQFNECNTDHGAYINPDVLEDVTETTGGSYPEMRSSEPPDTEYNCVPPSKINSPNWMGHISPIPKQIDMLQTSTQPMVTEPDCMKMKSTIPITNLDMNSGKMIMQVSQTGVIQTMVLSLIQMFWRTL